MESKIILADGVDERALREGRAGEQLSRQERRRQEREAEKRRADGLKAVTRDEMPRFVVAIVDPAIQRLYTMMRESDLNQLALFRVLIDKGIITEEELMAKLVEVAAENGGDLVEGAEDLSPARQEAEAASEGRKVERLDEPLEEDVARRRLVEG